MNRYNFRVNSDHVVMKKGNLDFLKVGETINYKYSQTQGSFGTGGIYWNGVHNMLIMSPLMHPYNSDGGYYLYADQEKDNYKWDISIHTAFNKFSIPTNGTIMIRLDLDSSI